MIVALFGIVSTIDGIGVFTISTIVVSFGVTNTGISTSSDCIVVCTSESTGADVGVRELTHSQASW